MLICGTHVWQKSFGVSNFRWMDLRFLISLNPKTTFSAVCVCGCVICVTHKQITPKTPNLVFYISIICGYYLHLFRKSCKQSVYEGAQNNSNTLRLMDGISCQCILVYLVWAKYYEININFCYAQKHVSNRTEYEYHS